MVNVSNAVIQETVPRSSDELAGVKIPAWLHIELKDTQHQHFKRGIAVPTIGELLADAWQKARKLGTFARK